VLARAREFLIVTMLIVALGAHWAILQSAAWAGMFVRYAQDASIEQALKKPSAANFPASSASS
jgi:hypothetical protein